MIEQDMRPSAEPIIAPKQLVARLISPETWRCFDAWEDVPPGVRSAQERSLEKADQVLRLVGSPSYMEMLLRLRGYIAGVLDTPLTSEAIRNVIADWDREIAVTLNLDDAPDTPLSEGQSQ